MTRPDIIFAVLMLLLVLYGVFVRVHQVLRSKNRKYLRNKYPDGFIRRGRYYCFKKNQNPNSCTPYLNRIDDKKFKISEINKAGFVDCSVDFEGFISDQDPGVT